MSTLRTLACLDSMALAGSRRQVNPNTTPLDRLARFNLRGTSAEVLPELIEAAWAHRSV